MKRTLLEILAGLAVLVVLASFHHQISNLRSEREDVAGLKQLVKDAVDQTGQQQKTDSEDRAALLARLDTRIASLELQVTEASSQGVAANRLRDELDAARRESASFRAKIAQDVLRTRERVDAFHKEVRAIDEGAKASLVDAQSHLRDLADRVTPDPARLNNEVLAPTVQLNGDDTVGSGTLVFSDLNTEANRVESYVITSYHVIRNILADTPSARRRGIAITIYTEKGKAEERGDMVCHDERIDAALIRLRTNKKYNRLAHVVSAADAARIKVWDRVYALGCPLGNDPIPTQGEVASTSNELKGCNYWMINAPTYFGNSGGGIYLADTRELIGVFSKIYTHGKGNPIVVPHMGLCTPISSIHDWLRKEKMSFVLTTKQPTRPADLAAPPPAPAPAPGN